MTDVVRIDANGVAVEILAATTKRELFYRVHEGETEPRPIFHPDFIARTIEVESGTVALGDRFDGARFVTPPRARAEVTQVTPLQARRALRAVGRLDQVMAAVAAASDDDLKDAFEFALAWRKNDPHVRAMAAALGMDEAELTALFELAATK